MRKRIAGAAICLVAISGCATRVYDDITGQHRGQAQFVQDRGRCNMSGQQAAIQEQSVLSNQCSSKGNCNAVGFANGLAIGAARADAFNSCMEAAGWLARQQ
jgi:hypothetical protein